MAAAAVVGVTWGVFICCLPPGDLTGVEALKRLLKLMSRPRLVLNAGPNTELWTRVSWV